MQIFNAWELSVKTNDAFNNAALSDAAQNDITTSFDKIDPNIIAIAIKIKICYFMFIYRHKTLIFETKALTIFHAQFLTNAIHAMQLQWYAFTLYQCNFFIIYSLMSPVSVHLTSSPF